jgi:choline kinase
LARFERRSEVPRDGIAPPDSIRLAPQRRPPLEAVVLSAGQGRRLLPLTRSLPKCLLPIAPDGRTVLDLQIATLASCGVERVTVMVGFGAEQVESHVRARPSDGCEVRTVLNPLHRHSDNLVTAWLASTLVQGDFVLLNGDTIFEREVLQRVLDARGSVRVAVNRKDSYDSDDMCVWVEDTGLIAIGKDHRDRSPNGEAIGLYAFAGGGVAAARRGFERAVAEADGLHSWYPPVIGKLARTEAFETVPIDGLWWTEIDVPEDLEKARVDFGSRFSGRVLRAARR